MSVFTNPLPVFTTGFDRESSYSVAELLELSDRWYGPDVRFALCGVCGCAFPAGPGYKRCGPCHSAGRSLEDRTGQGPHG